MTTSPFLLYFKCTVKLYRIDWAKYKRTTGETYSIIPEESDCDDGKSPIVDNATLNHAQSPGNVEPVCDIIENDQMDKCDVPFTDNETQQPGTSATVVSNVNILSQMNMEKIPEESEKVKHKLL